MADRAKTLQQAASTIFVLTAILPLLVFMWTLYRLNVLSTPAAQIGLGLSLALALLGFFILRSTMARLSEFTRALTKVAEARAQARPPAAQPAAQPAGQPGVSFPAPAPPVGHLPQVERLMDKKAAVAPAVGAISEFGDMTAAIASLWSREAIPHVGRPVLISVVRATEPLAGLLKEVTDEGLLLEREGKQVAVSYHRISGIEPQH
jgi:HAMP domain-containing protein